MDTEVREATKIMGLDVGATDNRTRFTMGDAQHRSFATDPKKRPFCLTSLGVWETGVCACGGRGDGGGDGARGGEGGREERRRRWCGHRTDMTCLSMPHRVACTELRCEVTWESDSPRPQHPSTTNNCWPPKAPKNFSAEMP